MVRRREYWPDPEEKRVSQKGRASAEKPDSLELTKLRVRGVKMYELIREDARA